MREMSGIEPSHSFGTCADTRNTHTHMRRSGNEKGKKVVEKVYKRGPSGEPRVKDPQQVEGHWNEEFGT